MLSSRVFCFLAPVSRLALVAVGLVTSSTLRFVPDTLESDLGLALPPSCERADDRVLGMVATLYQVISVANLESTMTLPND
jgi:hypothetical protein